MPTVQVPVQLTVEHLIAAAKQLSPVELREFIQHLAAWQQQDGQQVRRSLRSWQSLRKTHAYLPRYSGVTSSCAAKASAGH